MQASYRSTDTRPNRRAIPTFFYMNTIQTYSTNTKSRISVGPLCEGSIWTDEIYADENYVLLDRKDCSCTSLKPLFLMLNFLALTKSKSLPYSSLKKKVEID